MYTYRYIYLMYVYNDLLLALLRAKLGTKLFDKQHTALRRVRISDEEILRLRVRQQRDKRHLIHQAPRHIVVPNGPLTQRFHGHVLHFGPVIEKCQEWVSGVGIQELDDTRS